MGVSRLAAPEAHRGTEGEASPDYSGHSLALGETYATPRLDSLQNHLSAFGARSLTAQSKMRACRTVTKAVPSQAAMRVLVVDDNPDSVLTLSRLLGACGHEARTASSGAEALKVAEGFLPEAVFLDLWMPKMDGYTLAKGLRQIDGMQGARLISMSGANPDIPRATEAGIDVSLLKPASLAQLLESLARKLA